MASCTSKALSILAAKLGRAVYLILSKERVFNMEPEVPEWVFCSTTGTHWDEHNFNRVWYRLRRRAQKHGVRPLKLHTTRHTWAVVLLPLVSFPLPFVTNCLRVRVFYTFSRSIT